LCSSNDAFLPFVFFLLVSLFEDLTVGDCPDRLFCLVFSVGFSLVCFCISLGGAGEGALFLIALYLTAQIILLVLTTSSSNFARAIRDVVVL
jgi:hypothetical protein